MNNRTTSEPTTHQNTRASARIGPLVATHEPKQVLDVDALLDDRTRGIIVCCGSGGVGKTTTSAALALRAAERGRKVVVLTIDPARRLAQSMGIEALDNTPRPGARGRRRGQPAVLDAMMLDMKRTFDEVVQSQASPEKAEQILENPFYIAVSSSFAGTQEYMAMEKLGQLDKDARKTGPLGPDRGRHPAVAQRPGLPRRPGAPLQLPRRPVHEAAARARPGAGPADDGRLRDGHQRDHQDHRRPGAPGHEGVRGGVRHALRRVPAAGAAHLRAAPGPAYGVPGGRGARSRTRCARRRTSSSGCVRSRCRWRGSWSTGPAASPTGTCRPTRR